MVGDFNTPVLPIERPFIHNINRGVLELSDIINQIIRTNRHVFYRAFHLNKNIHYK